uniref:Fatty acid hydroxylase domain-containing protein n=1 Tax=Percolomonas cosmopolitus TaxID=63605 RepID=A0A7S1KST8_9EUKA
MTLFTLPIQSSLQSFWSHLVHTYPWYITQIALPFLSLIGTYTVCSIIGVWMERDQWIRKYKLQPKRTNSSEKLYHATIYLLKIYFLVILPLYASAFSFLHKFGFSTSEALPDWRLMVVQLLFFFFMEDMSHYWLHRWLHTDFGYKHIHRVHHEFDAPTALATTYAHPAEIIILGLATFSGPLIVRPHMFVLFIWVNLRQLAALETHCGHSLPFSLDRIKLFGMQLFGGSSFHDHHHRFLDGAFASNFVFWDVLCGTDKGYFEREARLQRKRARLSKERSD